MEYNRIGLPVFFTVISIFILSLSIMALGPFLRQTVPSPSVPDGQVVCTQDAKICPDGTAVGRTGPRCEFSPCPAATTSFGAEIAFTPNMSRTFADGLTLTLKEISDSRCRPEMVCVWAGELSAVFGIIGGSLGDSRREIRLGTMTQKETEEGGYAFTLREAATDMVVIVVRKPEPAASCFIGGCSGEICSGTADLVSACIYKPEFDCYKKATCERQSTGKCGWTQTPELARCLDESKQ